MLVSFVLGLQWPLHVMFSSFILPRVLGVAAGSLQMERRADGLERMQCRFPAESDQLPYRAVGCYAMGGMHEGTTIVQLMKLYAGAIADLSRGHVQAGC